MLQHTLPSRWPPPLAKHSLALQDEKLLHDLGKLPNLKESLLRTHLMVSFSCGAPGGFLDPEQSAERPAGNNHSCLGMR